MYYPARVFLQAEYSYPPIMHKSVPSMTNKRYGVLEMICRNEELDMLDIMLDIPEVAQIIHLKWQRFGFHMFVKTSLHRFAIVISIT
jgi:hypothetical protein